MPDVILNLLPVREEEKAAFEAAAPDAVHLYAGRRTATPEQFAQAQQQRQQRAQVREPDKHLGRYSARYPFSGLIVCAECGRSFCRKTYTYVNTRVYWKCWGNDQGLCANRTKIEEEQLVAAIRDHVNEHITNLEGWKQSVVDGVLNHISGVPQEESELERLEQRNDARLL